MKKIVINASVSGYIVNGFLVYCRELLRVLLPMLKDSGYDVTLVIPKGSILDVLDVKKKYLPSICGMPKKRSPINPICRLLFNFLVLPFYTRRGDIVYALTPHGAFWGPGKQILTVHDLIPLEFPKQHRLQYYYTRYCLPLMLRHSKKVICISKTTRDSVIGKFNQPSTKVEVIYNGCSEEFYPVANASILIEERYGVRDYLLACGVGFPHKNIKFLIDGYNQLPVELRQKHPLIVVGVNTDAYAQELMTYAAGLPCAKDIHFAGMVPQCDLPALYSAARVFVYPTLSEGFGMPPVEAVRCGTPCLVSNLPILREVVPMGEDRYFDPTDLATLVKCLEHELRKSKDVEGLDEHVSKYSWRENAIEALSVIEKLV